MNVTIRRVCSIGVGDIQTRWADMVGDSTNGLTPTIPSPRIHLVMVLPCVSALLGGYSTSGEDVIEEAKKSAIVSHNHPEGIKGAQCIAELSVGYA